MKKIKDLLADESKWTKGFSSRNVLGEPTLENDTNSVCWCLGGAIFHIYGPDTGEEIYQKVSTYVRENFYEYVSIWNDKPEREFEDVRKVINDLDI